MASPMPNNVHLCLKRLKVLLPFNEKNGSQRTENGQESIFLKEFRTFSCTIHKKAVPLEQN